MTNTKKIKVRLVATVGASLINNFRNALQEDAIRQEINQLGNIVDHLADGRIISPMDRDLLEQKIDIFLQRGQRYLHRGRSQWRLRKKEELKPNREASAELQSISQYLEENKDSIATIKIDLLATDTLLSKTAGELIAERLSIWYPDLLAEGQVECQTIAQLKLDRISEFNEGGLNNLLQAIYQVNKSRKKGEQLLLNMTGGYKGTIPVLALAAQLLGGQLLYSYEYQSLPTKTMVADPKSETLPAGPLLNIPAIDIHFIWDFLEAYRPLLDRMVGAGKNKDWELSKPEEDLIQNHLVPTGICKIEGDAYRLTALGKILSTWVEQRTPQGKSVLGYLLASKVYEYFLEEPWMDYRRVRSGYYFPPIPGQASSDRIQYQDVDVLLGETRGVWTWVEVKSMSQLSFAYFRGKKDTFKKQLASQMLAWQRQAIPAPQAYVICFYHYAFQDLKSKHLLSALQRIRTTVLESGIAEFRVFYFTLDLDLSDWWLHQVNPYTAKVASRKLTRDQALYDEKAKSNNRFDKYLLVQELEIPFHEI